MFDFLPDLPEFSSEALPSWLGAAAIAVGSAVIALIALIVLVRLIRRGKRAQARALKALDEVGARLVELDDATADIEREIGMASALYDGRPPATLRRARLTAQHTRDDAFAAYSDLSKDALLPSDRKRRATKLLAGINEALAIVEAAHADNETWIAEHSSASEQVTVARDRIDAVTERIGDPTALRADLERIADESEWEDAAEADQRARDALAEAEHHWKDARQTAENDASASVRESIRACEQALMRAERNTRHLEETHRLVTNAYLAVGDEAKAAHAAIRAAMGTQKALDDKEAPRLGEAIRVATVALEAAERVAYRRPVTANERIARLRDRLDKALANARTQQQRQRGARSALPGSLNAARSALARAEAIVTGPEVDARVRLDSARRELAVARQAHDPVEALDASRRAIRDAEEAAALAKFRTRRR